MMTSRERDEGHGEKTEEVTCFLMKMNGDSKTNTERRAWECGKCMTEKDGGRGLASIKADTH